MSRPALDDDCVVSIEKTELPAPSWILTAEVEEIFWVKSPYQPTFMSDVPEEFEKFSKFWKLVGLF